MLEWIGSLRIREKSPARVVLRLSKSTRLTGLLCAAVGLALLAQAWTIWPYLALAPVALVAGGLVLATLERELVIDREAGVLRVEQRVAGLSSRAVVPLFHLRAVVVTARATDGGKQGSRFVAYLDRRVGDAIYLDEARRCAQLMRLAEAIADVAELRLEYEASGMDNVG